MAGRGSGLLFGVALLEAVDAAAGVHDLVLAGVERMRLARHLNLDQRVFVAVFPLDGFLALDGRAGLEDQVAGHVLKNDFAVFGMDIGFHARDSCTDITESSRAFWLIPNSNASKTPLQAPAGVNSSCPGPNHRTAGH